MIDIYELLGARRTIVKMIKEQTDSHAKVKSDRTIELLKMCKLLEARSTLVRKLSNQEDEYDDLKTDKTLRLIQEIADITANLEEVDILVKPFKKHGELGNRLQMSEEKRRKLFMENDNLDDVIHNLSKLSNAVDEVEDLLQLEEDRNKYLNDRIAFLTSQLV